MKKFLTSVVLAGLLVVSASMPSFASEVSGVAGDITVSAGSSSSSEFDNALSDSGSTGGLAPLVALLEGLYILIRTL